MFCPILSHVSSWVDMGSSNSHLWWKNICLIMFDLDGFRNQLGSPTLQGIRRCRKTGKWISLTWKFQGELILQVDLANVSGPCSISGRWNKGRWVTSRVAIWRVEHAVCTKSHWEMWLWPQFPRRNSMKFLTYCLKRDWYVFLQVAKCYTGAHLCVCAHTSCTGPQGDGEDIWSN